MLGFLRAHRRVTTSAVAAALCTMLFATCLTAATQTERRMSCCPVMQDCGTVAMASSCCAVPSSPSHALIPARPAQPQKAVATVAATLLHVGSLPIVLHIRLKPDATSAGPPGVPTYLFVSSFRI